MIKQRNGFKNLVFCTDDDMVADNGIIWTMFQKSGLSMQFAVIQEQKVVLHMHIKADLEVNTHVIWTDLISLLGFDGK